MRRYLVILIVVTFALQWLWEMAQMFAYEETARRPWERAVRTCTFATVGDTIATLFVYGFIALIRRNSRWGLHPRAGDYLWAGVLGATIAIVVEHVAIAHNQWSYMEVMPVVPGLEVGVLPLLQLTLLVPLALWCAERGARRGHVSRRGAVPREHTGERQ